MTRWDGGNNDCVYERCSMRTCANGVKRGVVEWLKRNILRWFGHIKRMNSEQFVKKVYVSDIDSPSKRGAPLGRWKDRVKEYTVKEVPLEGEGLNKQRGIVWRGRGGCSSAVATTLGDIPGGNEASETDK